MTIQIGDFLHYEDRKYRLIARSACLCFSPRTYGLNPEEISSDCSRGYWCDYTIADRHFFLENLHINTKEDFYPEINGIAPLMDGAKATLMWGHHVYCGLRIPIAYTGNLLFADEQEIIRQKPYGFDVDLWEYRTLISLTFKNGILTNKEDHSQLGAAIRNHILNSNDLRNYSFMGCGKKSRIYDAGFHVWWLEEDPRKAEGWKIFVNKENIRCFMRLCQKTDFDKGKALEIIDHFGVNAIFDAPMANFKDTYRSTFLEIASLANNLPMIEFLFENGADPNLVDPEGKAEVVFWDLQYLWEDDWKIEDRLQIAEIFLRYGANPRIVVDGEELLSYLNFALGYIEDYDSKQYDYRVRFEKLLQEHDKKRGSIT